MNVFVETPFIQNRTRNDDSQRKAKRKTILEKLATTCKYKKTKVVVAVVLLFVVVGLVVTVYQNKTSSYKEGDVFKRPTTYKIYHGMKFERISQNDRRPVEISASVPGRHHHRCSFEFINSSFNCDWLKLLTNQGDASFKLNTDGNHNGCKGVRDFGHDNFYRFATFSAEPHWRAGEKYSARLISPRLGDFPFTLSFYHRVSCEQAGLSAVLVRETKIGPFEEVRTLFNSSAPIDSWSYFKTSVSLPEDNMFYRVILKAEITKKGNGTCKSSKTCENGFETQKVVVDEVMLEQSFPSCSVEKNDSVQTNWTLHGAWKNIKNEGSLGVRPIFLQRLNMKQLFTGRKNFFGLKLVEAFIYKNNYEKETFISSDLIVATGNCSCKLSFEWAKLNKHNSTHRIPMQAVQTFGVGMATRRKTLWSETAGFEESGVWNPVVTSLGIVDDNVPFRIEFYEVKRDKSSSLWFLLDRIELVGCKVKKYTEK